jgi:hypothetical protein
MGCAEGKVRCGRTLHLSSVCLSVYMIFLVIAVVAGIVAITMALTVKSWLVGVLNVLDRCLTKLGVGTWSARVLTCAEDWVAKQISGRSEKKVHDHRDQAERS